MEHGTGHGNERAGDGVVDGHLFRDFLGYQGLCGERNRHGKNRLRSGGTAEGTPAKPPEGGVVELIERRPMEM